MHSNEWITFAKNIEEYNPIKEHKIYIVFDDMIAGTLSYKKLNPIVTELLIRCKKTFFLFSI